MITKTLMLSRWEWFKLRRRWMPWVLLIILLLFSQLSVWGGYVSYNRLKSSGGEVPVPGAVIGPRGQIKTVSCNALRTDPGTALPGASQATIQALLTTCNAQQAQTTSQLQARYNRFVLPASLSDAFNVVSGIGLVLLAILTASAIGAEYALGTLRSVLARGTGRLRYLASKFLLLAALAAGALLIVSAVTILSSLIATGLAGTPPAGVTSASASWSSAAIDLGRTWTSLIPYLTLTAMVTILTRSSAAGMGIGLGYYFAEGILIALLTNFFDWFDTVANYFPVRNIEAFASGGNREAAFGVALNISLVHAGLMLAAYTVVLGFIAVRTFQQRDITSPSAG